MLRNHEPKVPTVGGDGANSPHGPGPRTDTNSARQHCPEIRIPRDNFKQPEAVRLDRLLGDAKIVAYLINHSVRQIRRLDIAGKMPRPLRKGRKVLWKLAEIRDWVEAGMPDRQTWEAIHQVAKHHGGRTNG
jgi:predicted DNA-binding transcriptional regulator AlpA